MISAYIFSELNRIVTEGVITLCNMYYLYLFLFYFRWFVSLFNEQALLRFSGLLLLLKIYDRSTAKMLVWLILCSFLPASTQAWTDMKERLKDRVVHVETLIHRGRWLWQNDNQDADGSRYLWIDLIAQQDTFYEPRVQFQVQLICVSRYSKVSM